MPEKIDYDEWLYEMGLFDILNLLDDPEEDHNYWLNKADFDEWCGYKNI